MCDEDRQRIEPDGHNHNIGTHSVVVRALSPPDLRCRSRKPDLGDDCVSSAFAAVL